MFVVLTVVWIGSGWVWVWYLTGTTVIGIGEGVVRCFDTLDTPFPQSAGLEVHPWYMGTQLPASQWTPGLWILIPLWIPALLAGVSTFVLWRRSRRIPPGHCKACRYDLTGNVSGVCPECGTSTGDG